MSNNSDTSQEQSNVFQLAVPLDSDTESKLMDFLQRVAPKVEQELRDKQEAREAVEMARKMKQEQLQKSEDV